jgi:hypothetical protein
MVQIHLRCKISGGGIGAGRDKDYTGEPVADNYTISWPQTVSLYPPVISALTTTEAEALVDVDFLGDLDPNYELPGYPGRDKIGFIAAEAGSGVTPNILVTVDGGSIWTALGADPFIADEHPAGIRVRFTSDVVYRVIVLRATTDASEPCEIAYADITVGNESASPTWVPVDLPGANADVGQALAWPYPTGVYAAAEGDINRSTDQGETWTQVYTSAVTINEIIGDSDENVWAVGGALILRESEANRGTFTVKSSPSGATIIHSIAVDSTGNVVYVGVDTKIYRSNNKAGTVGGWVEVNDFGANHAVFGIQLIEDNAEVLRVLVEDTTGTDGDIWDSLDGGNSFVQVTDVSNTGYTKWWTSIVDPTLAFVVGKIHSSLGLIHKLSF